LAHRVKRKTQRSGVEPLSRQTVESRFHYSRFNAFRLAKSTFDKSSAVM
jgi:hypothetical protein